WRDVATINPADLSDYKTIVIDTAGRALDLLAPALIADDPKHGNKAGALSLQGYGALRTTFSAWNGRLKQAGLDVVLIAHMDEQRKGDEVIERIDVQGGSKNEIYKSADAMARLYMATGARMLNFSPSDVAHGKNPGRLEPLPVPVFSGTSTFLGDVIGRIKATLNAESEATRALREALADRRAAFEALSDASAFTAEAVALAASKAAPALKLLLLEVAKGKGFTFDPKAKEFVVVP